MSERLLVVRYGEIALKGNNRNLFENQLTKNMKLMLKTIGGCKVYKEHGRIFVTYDASDHDEVVEVIKKVFGIVSFSPAEVLDMDFEAAILVAIKQLKRIVEKKGPLTFKVETKRANKQFPLKSPAVSMEVGGRLLAEIDQIQVDVHRPQVTVHIEIRDRIYVYTEMIKGQGGMPYKSAGKGMLLLSGGIDSPVSGYLMARRGLQIEAVHFHSYPFTSERAKEKVLELARKLAIYTSQLRVHSINLLEIQRAIAENCPSEEMTILSRRFMMAIATQVAKQRMCKALITGESLGQVASQTIEGLTVTNDATSLPVFRPLIAMDKLDIMDIAHKIDTYETSILPYEDCCTVFLPDRVVTKPRLDSIIKSESLLDKEGLIERAIAQMEAYVIRGEESYEM